MMKMIIVMVLAYAALWLLRPVLDRVLAIVGPLQTVLSTPLGR